jgi:hypothetical protein
MRLWRALMSVVEGRHPTNNKSCLSTTAAIVSGRPRRDNQIYPKRPFDSSWQEAPRDPFATLAVDKVCQPAVDYSVEATVREHRPAI